MTKQHCHEIEVKYKVQKDKVEKIIASLEKLGFTFKSTTKVMDKWLPIGKEWIRLREEKKINGGSKHQIASKKTIEKDGGLKNKCEAESDINKFTSSVLLNLAKQIRRALPTVHKTRTTFAATINGRKYTAVIDHVEKLGKFNGYYFELETLVPFKVDDPTAKSDVKKLASKLLSLAYKGVKGKPTKCELMSYRKMALAQQAKQRRAKQLKLKLKPAKPKRATKGQPTHHCH